MWGLDIQQRRYVADAPRPLEGRLVWSADLGSPTRSVPVIVDDVIYVGGHFQILALDAHTGHRLWVIPTTGPVHTSPAVAGHQLYVGLQDWRVLALDRHTGKTLWEFTMQSSVSGSASVARGIAYIGSMDGFLYALDAATGTLIWKFKSAEQVLSPPAIAAGTLFLSSGDGSLYALHARTGQSWLRFRTPERLQDAPVVANGLVYFPSGGQIYAVSADARESPANTNSPWSGLSSGSGSSRCRGRPVSPEAGGASPPANGPAGLFPRQQWPPTLYMWVILMAIFTPEMPRKAERCGSLRLADPLWPHRRSSAQASTSGHWTASSMPWTVRMVRFSGHSASMRPSMPPQWWPADACTYGPKMGGSIA